MIAIIDYGMGNLRSVQKAFEFLGFEAIITQDPKEILKADKVVLPGVGAFCDAISTIKEKKLDEVIFEVVKENKPLLGICIGMQLMFDKSYENGEYAGLGILSGEVVKLPDTEIIPQIGLNNLDIKRETPLFDGLSEEDYVYFVHSYHVETSAPIVSATCYYGKEINVAVEKNNIYALQFHPEKSGDVGLKILKNFGRL